MKLKSLILIGTVLLFSNCEKPKPELVLEVTTFNLKTTASQQMFNTLDAEVELNFTSQQPGFIKRQSTVDENGNYMVIVYWNTLADAEASMSKFMGDASVADYAGMIEGASMQMNRYTINTDFQATNSQFTEMMSFDLKDGVEAKSFETINTAVANETATKEGFMQRITGSNEEGRKVVVVYWDTKENSDAYIQPFMNNPTSKEFMGMMNQSSIKMLRSSTLASIDIALSNKDKVVALLNSFNTGDQTPISYINPNKYIQHNLSVADGLQGFGEIMKNAPEGGFKANVVRAFEDGNYVFAQTEYDFFGPKAAFDVFRFEDGLIVEHWDNMLEVQQPNPSGHTQFDGAMALTDLDKTESNKQTVRTLLENVFMNGEMDKIATYINPKNYIQHNPNVPDGLDGLGEAMKAMAEKGMMMEYDTVHKVLGQGNFVLAMSEGKFGGQPTAYYDLFRLEDGQIVEHWDVIAPIPPKSEWKNTNGKF